MVTFNSKPPRRQPPAYPGRHGSTHRLLSRPIGVEWAGWNTDTLRLQQSGWKLAVEHTLHDNQYRLLCHHREMKMYALTGAERIDYALATNPAGDHSRIPFFRVQCVASEMQVIRIMDDLTRFQPIDAKPCMTQEEITSIEDMNIFNVVLTRAEEIVVDKADMSVIEHLQAIKDLQSDEQKKIRDRIIKEGSDPEGQIVGAGERMNVIANIVEFRRSA